MWLLLLMILLIAAFIHARIRYPNSRHAIAELSLIYLLSGYCGLAQIALGLGLLVIGDPVMMHMGFKPGQPVFLWASFMLIGGGIIATLTIWRRGSFLLAPVIFWSVFFAGATYAHIKLELLNGHSLTATSIAWIFAAHGLVSVLLTGLYWNLFGQAPAQPAAA